MKKSIFIYLFLAISPLILGQEQTNERAKWFVDARFGMFIHWGVYSGAEGIWKGEKLRYHNNYAEWIYYRNRIARSEYVTLLDRFDWEEIDPEEWVLLAKEAGMKYVTITAKHHDGFAIWDSEVSKYNIAEYTNPKRDIIKELSTACKKHGLKMGLYYSHWVDWEHPNGWDHSKEIYGISNEQYDRYWQEKVIPQIRELLTNYGNIGLIWFDMWVPHSQTIVTKKQLLQLKYLIRELQPNCLVNSRLGLSVEEDPDIDFQTLGDNELGNKKKYYPWQTSGTVAHSWGFNAYEEQWKSTTTLLHSLINNVSLNGNFMLNIGPRANGDVPFEIETRLREMGQWLAVNGEAVYGSKAFDLPRNQHDWGKITCKICASGKTKLYLHVFNWPLNKKLILTGIKGTPIKASLLGDKQKQALPLAKKRIVTEIGLPPVQPDPYVSVIELEYEKYPEIEDGLVAQSVYSGYSLTPTNVSTMTGDTLIEPTKHSGSIPAHIKILKSSSYQWRIFIDKPQLIRVDASYNFKGEKGNGIITVKVADTVLSEQVIPTGKYVGEPNSNWQIDCFDSHCLGKIKFSQQGFYNIFLEVAPKKNESIEFQWLWLGQDNTIRN